ILGGLFDLEQKQADIEQLELKMTSPDFWDDQNGAQEVIDELNSLKKQVEDFTSLISRMDDIETMFELVNETDDEEMKQEMEEALNHEDDEESEQEVINELNRLKKKFEYLNSLIYRMDDIENMFELVNETDDEEMKQEMEEALNHEDDAVKNFELEMLLSEPYDKNNAILELHPGAGGTESQDWASILLRMYQRWAEHKHYK